MDQPAKKDSHESGEMSQTTIDSSDPGSIAKLIETENQFATSGNSNSRVKRREVRGQFRDLEELRKEFVSKEEGFEVSADEEIEIVGKQGTRIYVPKEGLLRSNGEIVTGKVRIQLIECYNNVSFFAHQLNTTTTSDELLESGGMIRVIALQDGDTLTNAPMQPMTVCFPKNGTDKPGMRSFLGEENSEGGMDWKIDPVAVPGEQLTGVSDLQMKWNDLSRSGPMVTKRFQMSMARPKTDEGDEKIVWDFKDSVGTLDEWMAKQVWDRRMSPLSMAEKEFTMKVSVTLTERGTVESVTSTHLVDQPTLDQLYMFFRKAPQLNMHGKRSKVKYAIYLNGKQVNENSSFASELKKQNGEGRATKLGKVPDADLKYYIMEVSQLGWINCDRFSRDDRERVALRVSGEENTEVYVVFTKVKSQMGHLIQSGGTYFENLPKGEPIKIVAMKKENDEILLSVKETVVGNKLIQVAPKAPATLEDIERAFAIK